MIEYGWDGNYQYYVRKLVCLKIVDLPTMCFVLTWNMIFQSRVSVHIMLLDNPENYHWRWEWQEVSGRFKVLGQTIIIAFWFQAWLCLKIRGNPVPSSLVQHQFPLIFRQKHHEFLLVLSKHMSENQWTSSISPAVRNHQFSLGSPFRPLGSTVKMRFSVVPATYNNWLVVRNMFFFHILGRIIPTDYILFFRGVGQPPTRYG